MSDARWALFDGWCASQGVDPEELRWDRFLNLVYFYLVRNMDQKQKDEADQEIARVVAKWYTEKIATSRKAAIPPKVSDTLTPNRPTASRKGLPPRPPGWGDDAEISRGNLIAAQALKQRG